MFYFKWECRRVTDKYFFQISCTLSIDNKATVQYIWVIQTTSMKDCKFTPMLTSTHLKNKKNESNEWTVIFRNYPQWNFGETPRNRPGNLLSDFVRAITKKFMSDTAARADMWRTNNPFYNSPSLTNQHWDNRDS